MAYNQGNPYQHPQSQVTYGQPQNQNNAGPPAQYGYWSPPQNNQGTVQPYSYGPTQQSHPNYQAPVPYPGGTPQPWPTTNVNQRQSRSLILALLAFPLLALKIYLLPSPATFTREKERAGWLALFLLLLSGAALTGAGAYLWGRIPSLNLGITELSMDRLTPQPLTSGFCIFLAISVPVLFFFLESILRWAAKKLGGTGAFRAQIYTGLLIEAPLFVFVAAAAAILIYNPTYGSSLRLVFAGVAAAFLLYGFLLHMFAVMAVQQISAGKALLSIALILVMLIVLVVLLAALGESSSDSQGSGSHATKDSSSRQEPSGGESADGGNNEGSSRKRPSWARYFMCPACGQHLTLPASLVKANPPCPRCMAQMVDWR